MFCHPAYCRHILNLGNRGVIASVLSLVYRAEAMHTDDGTWKYTAVLICAVVENDVAIIVSCTPGFANFTRVHISELWIVKSLRSTLGGSRSVRSGFVKKPSWNSKEDPNRPRTGKGSGKKSNKHSDELSDTFILQSVSNAERGEAVCHISQPPVSPGILRTIDVDLSQESHGRPDFMHDAGVREPQVQNYPVGVFYYGPGKPQPPAESAWFYYVPSQD